METTVAAATTVKSARKRLGALVGEVCDGTVAVTITGKRGRAVLISQERYTALQEANFLLRSPELMASLRHEMARSLTAAESERARVAAGDRKKRKKRGK